MSITIKVEEFIKGRREMVRIISFEALSQDRLPPDYLDEVPCCYLDPYGNLRLAVESSFQQIPCFKIYQRGLEMDAWNFRELVEKVRECGEHLHLIPRRGGWGGERTYTI